MANLSTGNQTHLCQFCSDEFSNRATLTAHILQCQIKKSTKKLNDKILSSSQLNQTQLDILDMVKLQPSNKKLTSNTFNHPISTNDVNLQIPLSNLYSHGYVLSSKQLTFDDKYCDFDNFETQNSIINDNDEHINSNILNNKSISYHIYKYSRHERNLFYSRIKRALFKKNFLTTTSSTTSSTTTATNKYRSKDFLSCIFNQTNFLINIPTKIYSRQRINSNTNNIYPLLFSPNFNTLVKLSINPLLKNYLFNIRIYFHLINSIASQEFQFIVHNYDNQHQFSFTSLSFINILRQTMYDYTMNLQKTFKRNYFQSFHSENHDDDDVDNEDDDDNNDNEHESTINHDNELSIPPLKIRRYDDSSYEIEKRSISSTTSSSSGMSITQINNGQQQQQYDDRRRLDTRTKKFPMKFSDNQINSNFNDSEKKDISDLTVGSPLQCDLSITDHQHSQDGTNNEAFLCSSSSHIGEQKSKKTTSPILNREQTNESLPKYQSVVLNDGARIRIVNCSNDSTKHSSSRNSTNSTTIKKFSIPIDKIDKIDENCTTKSTRINTRKISSTNTKIPDTLEIVPSYQAQSVILSQNEISNQWLAHSVFYRCHVCSHEEFFVVLSRECIRLHISSKHGNMEENFKQRISNFLNNQGRALKIFQHYLKWQQPWSEKEIDQIFQLSNINNRTNGSF
ncbi:unnamed protein product [Rotaria sordida]|uniref:Uncharacterized protein n=1 Tax=Rotaria sordida TaxID=392033 RepID=A0A818U3E0_9BILA|nr:unnamed protein product [Rotaria sordida]CAF0758776.1 unnamed protein product [Rotaria sordida]CAF0802554.1 unnamed protein product [Rotaria sordida]CAF3556449.1 unnamed protein product [Rotaria sordida]CAF3667364.1 unnamed protein product [Rotaria sordida]